MIRGIPTLYRGVMMRSRLEARYAAYFDARGWSWIYEPFELDGSYTPDFLVTMAEGTWGYLVEVKPATKLGQLASPIARILRAGWRGPWMVVGADPNVCMEGYGRREHRRRYLGTEAPEAWSHACNVTQWKPPSADFWRNTKPVATLPVCAKCGRQDHPLHARICK